MINAFNSKPEVIQAGVDYLVYLCVFYPVAGYLFTMSGVFRGAGDATAAMLFSVLAMWVIRIPAAYLLSATSLGYLGIPLSQGIAWSIEAVVCFVYYRMGRWKTKSVVKDVEDEAVSANG